MDLSFELIPFSGGLLQAQAVSEVVKRNDTTRPFGLTLTPQQATELVATRTDALQQTGRIEFGGGVIDKIILAFCDSPYLHSQNYAQTLHELIEMFYYYKSETQDLMGDDELIRWMKTSFDGVCQGSLELLSGRELYRLAKNLRHGLPANHSEDSPKKEEHHD